MQNLQTKKIPKKKIVLTMTQEEFDAACECVDTVSAMIGGGDEAFNNEGTRNVKLFDKMLKRHTLKRKYN